MTESVWYSIIGEWEESELTQQDFCLSKNLNYKEFRYWRTKGISEGLFKTSNRWRNKSEDLANEAMTFSKIGTIDPQSKLDTKYMEVCLPYGITLKLPV